MTVASTGPVDLDHLISAFMFDALMDLTVGAQLDSIKEPKYFEAWMTMLSWIIWNFSIGGVPYWKVHKTAFRKKYEEADALVRRNRLLFFCFGLKDRNKQNKDP